MQGTSAAVPSARPGKIGGMIGSMARNLLALALLAGCAAPRIEYRPIPDGLIPEKPALPTVSADELHCLSDDAYTALVERDRLLRDYSGKCRALLGDGAIK